ncbi:hypothetical protein LEP1GSC194_1280 [Leptospira alstonii serovar Sichuan str. 79601]|uniref:Uncharacterized protein n=1 Tax=Leptospira alstonii serovar Sichuan str. 79601 TaxID=1218565 RepID=M6CQ16_9LEPT|nr:hypothetical protein LEP1GSC194_1280 [Leptospira alstonii serovar Sichuan str. 79601]
MNRISKTFGKNVSSFAKVQSGLKNCKNFLYRRIRHTKIHWKEKDRPNLWQQFS